MQLTSLVLNHVESGKASTKPRFGSALRLYVDNDGGGTTYGAFAVLIAPRVAVTTSHCVTQWQRNLHVRAALNGESAEVDRICWPGGVEFVLGDDVRDYPAINPPVADEDLVVLRLKTPITGTAAAVLQEPPMPDYSITVAAEADGQSNQVTTAKLRVFAADRGQFQAMEVSKALGFPYASGAPAFLDAAKSRNAIVGVQVGVVQPTPSEPAGKRVATFVAITKTRRDWLLAQIDAADAAKPARPPVRRSALRPLGGRTAAKPASAPLEPTAEPRSFVISRTNGSLHSENDCLVEIDDVDFFHARAWNLAATGTLHLLTSEGTLWTRREPGTDAIRAQIVINDNMNDRVAVDVLLALAGKDGVSDRLWLHGSTAFAGDTVHVYLFRVTDDPDAGQSYRRRIRVEAYVEGGVHMQDLPDGHTILFGRCDLIQPAPERTAGVSPLERSGETGDQVWPVQDDVANGHEGHKPK